MEIFAFALIALFLAGIPGLFGSRIASLFHRFSCACQALAGVLFVVVGGRAMGGDSWNWIPLDLNFIGKCIFGVDALSGPFLFILGIVTFSASLFAVGYLGHFREKWNFHWLHPLTSVFIGAMAGVFTARNILGFLGMWELMALSSFGLVVFESLHEKQRRTGFMYLTITHVATAFLFFALLSPAMRSNLGFSLEAWKQGILLMGDLERNLVLAAFIIGFGTKAGLIPFHVWLPRAHPQAPANISALMSGVMIKTGIYGILRFMAFPELTVPLVHGWVILTLGFISAVLGVLYALNEHHLKTLLAYSSVENIGIVCLALGMGFLFKSYGRELESTLAFTAAIFHAFNHALFKSLLFLGAGAIQSQTHSGNMNDLGGLVRVMPKTSVLFFIGAVAISALPPTNGFAGEWLIYRCLIAGFTLPSMTCKIFLPLLAAFMALAGALAAGCFVMAFGTLFLGKPRTDHSRKPVESEPLMLVAMGLPALLCLVFGIFPDWVTNPFSGFDGRAGLTFPAAAPLMWMNNSVESFAPLGLLTLLTAGVLLGWFITTRGGNRRAVVEPGDTWNCGTPLTERMSYSPSAFAEPFKVNFAALFHPNRSLVAVPEESTFPRKWVYQLRTRKIFEEYLYKPVLNFFLSLSHRIQKLQTGSIHVYLFVMFIVVVILLATGL